jgi:two-component system response regulator FlrC
MLNETRLPIAVDPRSKAMLEVARKAAKSMATVLISGETGVGKEVLAHYIHHSSGFAHGPFISVNCAALPDNMIEAILFGYEKGAFTNAINSYTGKFEQAQNGTLLLDEISEISIALQAKLLRVLQEREIERLGGKKPVQINVRIIAATNRDLNQQVVMGAFRKDLFYRLNVIPIVCPPLRDRAMDILPMAEYLLSHHASSLSRNIPALTELAKMKLMNYRWPGNIREMDNVIQRALIMCEQDVIDAHEIVLQENLVEVGGNSEVIELEKFSSRLEENEAKVIMDVLKETEGCRNDAAKILNISPRTLRYKIAKLRSIGLKIPKI